MKTKPVLYLLFNHTLTQEQSNDAYATLKVADIIYAPRELLSLWRSIPPELPHIKERLYPLYDYMFKTCKAGDYMLIQGDFGATYQVVQKALSLGLIPLYATTKRYAVEKMIEGQMVKRSLFRHVMFRRYVA